MTFDLTQFGTTGLWLLFWFFVLRALVSQWLALDLEQYKKRLELENTRAVEQLRSALERTSAEHRIRFSRLHEQRATAMISLYSKVARLSRTWSLIGDALEESLLDQFQDALRTFYQEFDEKQILFSEETCRLVDGLIKHLALDWQIVAGTVAETTGDGLAFLQARQKRLLEPEQRDALARIRRAIEKDFRQLLGVEPPAGPKAD